MTRQNKRYECAGFHKAVKYHGQRAVKTRPSRLWWNYSFYTSQRLFEVDSKYAELLGY